MQKNTDFTDTLQIEQNSVNVRRGSQGLVPSNKEIILSTKRPQQSQVINQIEQWNNDDSDQK